MYGELSNGTAGRNIQGVIYRAFRVVLGGRSVWQEVMARRSNMVAEVSMSATKHDAVTALEYGWGNE